MTAVLDLREDHAAIVRDVLRAHLPQGARAFVFGSRAHGGVRLYSDLDLALEWDKPLGLDVIGEIAEALSESDLPYKVDIVDLLTAERGFRARIAAECIPFDVAAHPDLRAPRKRATLNPTVGPQERRPTKAGE